MSLRRRALTVMLIGVLALTSCASFSAQKEKTLFETAKTVNAEFKAAVAEVQMQILDGIWESEDYGNIPDECGANGYTFDIRRGSPLTNGWHLPKPAAEFADYLAKWMVDAGWSDVKVRGYAVTSTTFTLEARNPKRHVDTFSAQFISGATKDSAYVKASMTCEPGNARELKVLMFPGYPSFDNLEKVPSDEHPTATPMFERKRIPPTTRPPASPMPTITP